MPTLTRRAFLKNATLSAMALTMPSAMHAAGQTAPSQPNVLFLLADDLGWADLSIHGGSIPTPHIDQFFRQGVEFRNYMGWCVCSPTRAMLLTGRHPFRVGTGPEVGGELEAKEATIAEAFKAGGPAAWCGHRCPCRKANPGGRPQAVQNHRRFRRSSTNCPSPIRHRLRGG